MGIITAPVKVKLIMGLLFNKTVEYSNISDILTKEFGNIDCKTEIEEFKFTDYYKKEMGAVLLRQYVTFEKLIVPEILADIKIRTNEIEDDLSISGRRNVNIDPGYLELGKLVLASTKNYTHRIYIGKGIYAEPTLQFFKKTYTKWPFSYPDYSDAKSVEFFNYARGVYKNQLDSQ